MLTSDLLKRTLGILGSSIEYVNPKERSETKSKWVIGIRHPSETDDEADLRAAITRIVEIGYDEFRAKVLSFIEPAVLPLYEPVEAWEGMQMTVIERLEGLLP
jgi:hypothetical protein